MGNTLATVADLEKRALETITATFEGVAVTVNGDAGADDIVKGLEKRDPKGAKKSKKKPKKCDKKAIKAGLCTKKKKKKN